MAKTAIDVRANALKTTNGFWWADLSSTDDAAAAAFYGEVFGWEWNELPMGDMVHRDGQIGGKLVAGVDPVMPGSDMPTTWGNYVFVDDIQATWAKALELGATGLGEPMDVMGQGWIGALIDPTGAFFGLWQPGLHTGADAVNQPGTYTWVELATTDLAAARSFYAELFGWEWEDSSTDDWEYWQATLDGRPFAGLMNTPPESKMDAFWTPYFGTADIAATVEAARAGGATICFDPMRMGPGTGVGIIDPTGGYFVAFQLDEWPTD
jgi:predicted enzyme related to lactoylglutathione lyase